VAVVERFLAALEAKLQPLLQAPSIGSPRDQIAQGLRAVFHVPYAIYYLLSDQELIIVRVLHGARDVTAISDQGGFDFPPASRG
jgi:toxin ParE1/3/4